MKKTGNNHSNLLDSLIKKSYSIDSQDHNLEDQNNEFSHEEEALPRVNMLNSEDPVILEGGRKIKDVADYDNGVSVQKIPFVVDVLGILDDNREITIEDSTDPFIINNNWINVLIEESPEMTYEEALSLVKDHIRANILIYRSLLRAQTGFQS